MLIVGIILCILAVIVTLEGDTCDGVAEFGSVFLGVINVVICVWATAIFVDGLTAKDKIKMYQEENAKIEEQINVLVKQYMEFEKETFIEFKSESSMTLVSLFPELKSDELVQKQMNVYIENNKKIKELKEDLINMKIGKWLLYFGK